MNWLTLDTETRFGDDYTVKKMSTEHYVRDERFKMHMVGIKQPDQPCYILTADSLRNDQRARALIQSSAVIAQHAHFDGLILSHHFNLRPALWIDTLSMARLVLPALKSHSLGALATHFNLPEKNVPYNLFKNVRDLSPELFAQVADGCMHDCALTEAIAFKLLPLVPRDEITVIDQTIRMFSEPVLQLDRPRMETFLQAEKRRKAEAMLKAGAALGLPPFDPATGLPGLMERLETIEAQLQSSAQFRIALEALGYPCPMKPSPKVAGEMIPAIAKSDDEMKELLEHEDTAVQSLAAARLGVKSTIDETRAERLLDAHARGALPVYLAYAAAKTLRFGGGDKTNWQNFRRGGEIRKSIKAPEGYKLVIADAAQVECRGVNWLAGEQWVLDAFAEGRDVYSETATQIFSRPVTKDDKIERFSGKTVELGCGFGLGWRKYQRQMRAGMLGGPSVILTDDEAQRNVNIYRDSHPHVKAYWKVHNDYILPLLGNGGSGDVGCLRIADQKIYLPNGTWIDYGGIYWGYFGDTPQQDEEPQWWVPSRRGKSKYYGGKLVENVTQALWSGLFIREAMARIGARYKLVLQVHDEIVACVPEAEAETALEYMLTVLRTSPAWAFDIPLDAEGIVSDIYEK